VILRNSIGLETRHGYRTFELHEGDLTHPDAVADLLVVSAFAGSYHPTTGTVLGSLLKAWGIDIRSLRPQIDLREPLGVWITPELNVGNFRRLICIELVGGEHDLSDVLKNVFIGLAVVEAKGWSAASLAMPLLGAGLQQVDHAFAMSILVPAAKAALERSSTLSRILFVEKNAERVTALDEAMNQVLDRSSVTVPKGQLMVNLRGDICRRIDYALKAVPTTHKRLFEEMRRIVGDDGTQSFEIGMIARRLVEFVVDDLLRRVKTSPDLARKIDDLAHIGIASWIRGYMHTLRILGNESAHEKGAEGRLPPYVDEEDLAICLFCFQRILGFWMTLEKKAEAWKSSIEVGGGSG